MNEQQIIKQILKSGDGSQYRVLVEKYHKGLISYLYGYVRDHATAEDLAQEAFIKAYNNLHKYKPDYAFSTWLYKIATNLAYSHLRKRRDLPLDETLLPDVKSNAGERIDKKIQAHQIRQCIAKLPNNYRHVIELYYWHGFTYDEVAETVNAPVGTIKTWLYRAKAELRKELSYE